jgi:hypothetical protein
VHYLPRAMIVPPARARSGSSRCRAVLALTASIAVGVLRFGVGRMLAGSSASSCLARSPCTIW